MSSRRYQEDIRRIVGLQDTQGGLDNALPRMRIEGQRGIFLIGAGETQSGASPGETEDGETTDPIMPDENSDNQNDDGSGTGGSGTDPDATNPDDFEIDPEDSGNFSPTDSTFGGNWASGGPTRFDDCASGKCIEVVPTGGYVPPEGWDDADVPPEYTGWEPGTYWSSQASLINNAAPTALQSCKEWDSRSSVENYTGNSAICRFTLESGSSPSIQVTRKTCGMNSPPEVGQFCSITEPPSPDFWPSDNCIQLVKNADGQWAASSRENPSDMTAKYSEPKSTLDLCTPNGDGVQVLPGADGGDVYWNYTQGIFRAVSPDGKQSFGGATEVTTAVAGSAAGGGAIKPQGAPVPGA